MLSTDTINQLSTTRPDLFAFRIEGTVTKEDMTEMAEHMNKVFDGHDEVDMLLYFDGFKGSDADASLSFENLKARARSLSSVRRYAVANAPDTADAMIEFFDKAIPVDAETYDSADEAFTALEASSMTTP